MPTDPAVRIHDAAQTDAPSATASAALLVPAEEAARICHRSKASWWRDHAAGRIPAPVKLGGSTLWRLEELRVWIDAGCPDRRTWEAMRARRGGGR